MTTAPDAQASAGGYVYNSSAYAGLHVNGVGITSENGKVNTSIFPGESSGQKAGMADVGWFTIPSGCAHIWVNGVLRKSLIGKGGYRIYNNDSINVRRVKC